MLIVPLSGRMSMKNPPWVTLLLILANCLVFFFLLSTDMRIMQEAYDYYLKSGLAGIEVKVYELHKKGSPLSNVPPEEYAYKGNDVEARLEKMHRDRDFKDKLEKGQIIKPGDGIYASWKEKKDHFQSILERTSTYRYGFIPSEWSIKGAFTYMFMHGGFMHLFGNMVFLWLAGCVIEIAWGRLMYLWVYIGGGLTSVLLFWLAYQDSTTPLVGASGAIAALMGAYAVLYGRRKIKIFYSLGFYFNYTMVPGFMILGAWVGNEIFQLLSNTESSVAYMAHIGGFSGGALMGIINQRFLGKLSERLFEPDQGEKIPMLLDQAMKKVEVLDLSGARTLFEQVLALQPGNRTALTQIYHMDKTMPDAEAFHESTRRLLYCLIRDKHAHMEVKNIYQEYLQKAKSPRLPAGLLFSIVSYFASTGHEDETEKVIGMLLKKSPDLPKMPEVLLQLARAALKKGLVDRGRNYLQVICLRYPLSNEYATAKRMLDDMG